MLRADCEHLSYLILITGLRLAELIKRVEEYNFPEVRRIAETIAGTRDAWKEEPVKSEYERLTKAIEEANIPKIKEHAERTARWVASFLGQKIVECEVAPPPQPPPPPRPPIKPVPPLKLKDILKQKSK